jgi:hypothetical protein
VLDPIDGCTTIKDDIKGKIAIIQYDGDLCYPDIVMRNVLDAGASVSLVSRIENPFNFSYESFK